MERSNVVVDYKCAESYKGMVLLMLKSIPIRVVAEAIRGAVSGENGCYEKGRSLAGAESHRYTELICACYCEPCLTRKQRI